MTHWKRTGVDEFNQNIYAPPVEVVAFWIDDESNMYSKESEDFVSMARVLSTDKIFNVDDRAQFSNLAESNVQDSFIVGRIKFVENGRQTSRLHTAILGMPG